MELDTMSVRAKSPPWQRRDSFIHRHRHRLRRRIERLLDLPDRTPSEEFELRLLQVQYAHNPPFVQPHPYRVRRPRRR
jgi:hypothetical protein